MRSPADMEMIQIDITNACNKKCSNCTRFCGNHKKPFFMDYETFRRAVDSLDGFDGITGIIGGEPTVHPEFERFVLYIREKFGERNEKNRLIYPQRNFIREVQRREFESRVLRGTEGSVRKFKMYGPGLWSNMSETYPAHYELIQDTFNVQFLNDHINPSYHQPGLVSRKDLGISNEDWIPMRNNCWVQNQWSATITPKGAFFCEVAGALDMLFDGPGGWEIKPDWWKRRPEDFGDQLHWCEICGFALDTFMRNAEEETDDVSPTLYEMLRQADSPGIKSGRSKLLKIENGAIAEESKAPGRHFSPWQPYIENYEDRFNQNNSALFARKYDVVQVADGADFGVKLNQKLNTAKGWILFLTRKDVNTDAAEELMKYYVLNPGTLHCGNGFFLFHKNAFSLRQYGFDGVACSSSFGDILKAWIPGKIVDLSTFQEDAKWVRPSITAGKRYVIWGTGLSGSFIADAVLESEGKLVFCIDRDEGKQGTAFFGAKVCRPEFLREHKDDFDYLLIGHYSRFDEIGKEAIALGIEQSRLIMPYEI